MSDADELDLHGALTNHPARKTIPPELEHTMKRTVSMLVVLAVISLTFGHPISAQKGGHQGTARLDLVEATVPELLKALQTKLVTSEQLVEMYLARIAAYDDAGPKLNAFLTVNPNAAAQARALDAARHPGIERSPLYGIPVLLKDNVDTADMPTTAGSVALEGSIPPDDAFITRKLRAAGAIIIGKATLTEFANFLTNGMPAGYSSLGGYGFNPYEPREDPRPLPFGDGRPVMTTGGSSSGSGIAVAANLAAVAVGTETSGSILSPASANMAVGIKPTVGLISRDGIIPITADQDTAGPITRTVTDAAILLGVLAGHDPSDPATDACLTPGNCFSDYTRFLDKNALAGARIAVPPIPANRADLMNAAIAVLRAQGAYVETVPALAPQLPGCPSTVFPPVEPWPPAGCGSALLYGFKRDLNAYLATLGPGSMVHSLSEVIAFNTANAAVALKYGQILAELSDSIDISPGSADTIQYTDARAQDIVKSRGALDFVYNGADGIQGTADDFDALLFSGNSGAGTPAKAGYPSITVPGGFAPPAAPIVNPTPSGVTFSGRAFSEPQLIGLAYAFEQATMHRRSPASTPPLPSDTVRRP
jgi:amidase